MRQHLPFHLLDEVIPGSSSHSPIQYQQSTGLPPAWTPHWAKSELLHYCPHLSKCGFWSFWQLWHHEDYITHSNYLFSSIFAKWTWKWFDRYHLITLISLEIADCWSAFPLYALFHIYSNIHLPKKIWKKLQFWFFKFIFPYFYWHQQNTFLPKNTSTWTWKKCSVFVILEKKTNKKTYLQLQKKVHDFN